MSQAASQPLDYLPLAAPVHRVNPWLIAVTVSMATFMEVLDTSIANVSLSHIAGNLGAGRDESTWVLTSYLVSNAIVLPISGWLASVLGRKRFYMSCVALFTASSFLCGMAPSLGWLLVFRCLQGIGGGGLAPSEQSILADTFEPRQRGMAFAIYGVAIVVAPAIGPTLGGWITDNYDWRWIFFINIPVGILSLILTYRLVSDSEGAKKEHQSVWRNGLRVDYIGFGLVALGLGCLQVMLDKGQEDDWFGSHFIQLVALLAAFGIIAAIIWEVFIAKDPIVDLSLLRNRSFLSVNVLMFIMGFILTATTVMLPQFVQQMLGYNATTAGLILMPGGFILMLMFPVAGALSNKVQPKYLMAIGLLITAAAMFHLAGFNNQVSFNHLAWARVYQCVGLPFFFVPINTVAYGDLPPGKSNNASALLNLMRNLGGSVGISVAVLLLERRAQLHQNRLGSHLSLFDAPFLSHFHALGGGRIALARIYGELQTQAVMLAYIDVFKIMAIGCLVVLALVMMLRKVKLGEKVQGH
ncbi:MAG TPA: DHA2 family efflux MFS transporter permease subunit [Tepidisphaeraceae bacterium]|nr:DHA2 family efflux MFS transporter permease subunit [Tepidisphaeraceae bacterium]